MRRFSSEGSLLDLDFLPWKRIELKNPEHKKKWKCGTYTPHTEEVELDRSFTGPTILEPRASPTETGKSQLTKEHSISVENLSELGKLDKSHLGVCVISDGCRAYSDSQLSPTSQESTESVERDDLPPLSPLLSSNPYLKSQHSHHIPKLSSAKLHLKSLFGQVGHQSILHCLVAYRQVLKKSLPSLDFP